MGIVFKVEKDGKEYALKICNTTDDEYVSRFKREIRMMETINNNRIVKIIDKDIDASIPYFIMELCDESLENAVERGLSEEKKFDYIPSTFCLIREQVRVSSVPWKMDCK